MGSIIQLVGNSLTDINEETQKENDKNAKYVNVKEKLLRIKLAVTIEPVLCCYLFAMVLCSPALNNLQLEMACRVNSGFNDTVCNAVVTATHAEQNFTKQNSEVQQYISDMLSWCIPIQKVVPVVLLLFIGSYSDRHRIRKPFLLLPIVGECIGTICSVVCALLRHVWPVQAVGISQFVISSFSGGPSLITMAAFAYIADVTSLEQRTARIAMIQICTYVCIPLATLVSGILFDVIGYIPSLLISILLYAVAFFYGLFFVKEPKQTNTNDKKDLLKDIVNPQHVVETFRLVIKSKGVQRENILFILVMSFILATVVGGEDYVFFYFTQHAYGWTYTNYTYFMGAYCIITSVGLAAGVFIFSKIFHLDDLIIIMLSSLDTIVCNLIYITIRSPLGLYIGVVVGILQEVGGAGIRSLSTKYVDEEDTGKTQSLTTIVEAIAYAIAAEIYHQGIYTYTRDTFIQAFFFVGVALHAVGIVIVIWKYLKQQKQSFVATNNNKSELTKQNSVSK